MINLVGDGYCGTCGCEPGYQDADCAGCDFCHGEWVNMNRMDRSTRMAVADMMSGVMARGCEIVLVLACSYFLIHIAVWAARGFPVTP